MEVECRRLDDQTVNASVDLVELNNLIVKMRKSVKKSKVQIIHKLCRTMKQLKNKKGTEDQVSKNKSKADRLYEEVSLIKDLPPDKVSKFTLANQTTFDEACKDPKLSLETRAMTRLACCPVMQNDVTLFREKHNDWESLAKFLIYKQTGRRYKKTRVKRAGSKAMKEMVVKQHSDAAADDSEQSTLQISKKKVEVENSGESESEREKNGSVEDSESEDTDSQSGEEVVPKSGLRGDLERPPCLESVGEGYDDEIEPQMEEDAKAASYESSETPSVVADSVYDKRLKQLNIFTVKDGDGESNRDDSSEGDELERDVVGSEERASDGDSEDEKFVSCYSNLGDSSSDHSSSSNNEDDSTSALQRVNKGSALKSSTTDSPLGLPKQTKTVGSVIKKSESDSYMPKKSKTLGKADTRISSGTKSPRKDTRTKKVVAVSKDDSNSESDDSGCSNVEQSSPPKPKEHKTIRKGAMVIQKFNLESDCSEDIAVASGDSDESEADVPSFLRQAVTKSPRKKETKDSFFVTGEGQSDNDLESDNNEDDVDSSGVEDEDHETTHDRGRQMMESVFIGTLSKKYDSNNFRGGRARGSSSHSDFGGRSRGFHYSRGQRGSFQGSRGHRGRGDFSRGHRGRGDFSGSRGRERGGHQRGFGSDRGRGSFYSAGGGQRQGQRGSERGRYSKPYENSSYGQKTQYSDNFGKNTSKVVGGKADDDGKKIHPSWEASRKRKEQASIHSFQGKKIKFGDDSD